MSAYELLADLAERELELVRSGAMDELPRVHSARDAIMESLPPRPPAEAREALERAAATQARVTMGLQIRRRELEAELARVGHGRVALRGYMPAGAANARRVDRSG